MNKGQKVIIILGTIAISILFFVYFSGYDEKNKQQKEEDTKQPLICLADCGDYTFLIENNASNKTTFFTARNKRTCNVTCNDTLIKEIIQKTEQPDLWVRID